jgi:hypothetical protein
VGAHLRRPRGHSETYWEWHPFLQVLATFISALFLRLVSHFTHFRVPACSFYGYSANPDNRLIAGTLIASTSRETEKEKTLAIFYALSRRHRPWRDMQSMEDLALRQINDSSHAERLRRNLDRKLDDLPLPLSQLLRRILHQLRPMSLKVVPQPLHQPTVRCSLDEDLLDGFAVFAVAGGGEDEGGRRGLGGDEEEDKELPEEGQSLGARSSEGDGL